MVEQPEIGRKSFEQNSNGFILEMSASSRRSGMNFYNNRYKYHEK